MASWAMPCTLKDHLYAHGIAMHHKTKTRNAHLHYYWTAESLAEYKQRQASYGGPNDNLYVATLLWTQPDWDDLDIYLEETQ